MIVTHVSHPELTPEEYSKRMERIKQAVVKLVLETEKAKILKNRRKTS
jgi:hypothetical protein